MINQDALISELSFKAVRSSGSGGQHVNKVSSKVELTFSVSESLVFNSEQKELLIQNLKTRLTKDNVLILQSDESRSQHKNKTLVFQRFLNLIKEGLQVPKVRVPTKTPKSAVRKRLKVKRVRSERKANRKKPGLD